MRVVVVAAPVLLLLAGAITSLTLQAGRGREAGRPPVTARAPTGRPGAQPIPARGRTPVSASDLRLAGRVAGRFLRSYLEFAYGRSRAISVAAVTPGLRRQLMRDRAEVVAGTALPPARIGELPRLVGAELLVGRDDLPRDLGDTDERAAQLPGRSAGGPERRTDPLAAPRSGLVS